MKIKDTALIIEGGGMRASYTAGIINTFLREKIYFDYVTGISAGASCCVNYISLDMDRTKKSFVDIVKDKNFGGWRNFAKGKGFFNSDYLYEEMGLRGNAMPFDFKTFKANSADFRIGAYEINKGELHYWSKKDVKEIKDLMKIVRASSSMPFFMPATKVFNGEYLDGGVMGGIALDIAKEEGYKKFFIIRTREKSYRKAPSKHEAVIRNYFKKYPKLSDAILTRYERYNQTLEEIEDLESSGKALVVYPEKMLVSSMDRDYKKLNCNYNCAYEQGKKEVERWKEFLY